MPEIRFDDLPPVPKTVRTRPLFVMHLKVRPLVMVGATPGVDRRIGLVQGGSFGGERLSGQVIDGGSDWQAVRADGCQQGIGSGNDQPGRDGGRGGGGPHV